MPMTRTHVLELLRTHTASDPEEAEAVETIRRLLTETPESVNLFDKQQTRPGHFTASAIATNPDRSAVLLIHHAAFGLWLQPGGHTDPEDSTLPEAALRELTEETGLHSNQARLIGLHDVAVHRVPDGIKGQAAHLHLDLRFSFEVDTGTVLVGEGRVPPQWFRLDQLEDIHTDASVRAAARRLGRPA